MSNNFLCDQLAALQPSAAAGIAGAASQARTTESRGNWRVKRFTYTTPASGGPQNGDTLTLCKLFPTDRILFGRIYAPAYGSGATLSIGKLDPNNSANNDAAHYLNAADVHAAVSVDLNLNMTEQVGADPAGDDSTGNTAPSFGSQAVLIQATYGGANPATGVTLTGIIAYVSD